MPKQQRQSPVSRSDSGGVHLSKSALVTAGAILPLLIACYYVITAIATKADVESIKNAISPQIQQHEVRIRELELQNAAHWGASPASIQHGSIDESPEQLKTKFLLAQFQQLPNAGSIPPPLPTRTAVIPLEFIKAFQLQPSRGGFYPLAGADGRLYALDDVMGALIELHMLEMKQLQRK